MIIVKVNGKTMYLETTMGKNTITWCLACDDMISMSDAAHVQEEEGYSTIDCGFDSFILSRQPNTNSMVAKWSCARLTKSESFPYKV